uniref:Uncharacterized protein n=1 Tax=Propithecus coquereli TaxID=379532 RepID=A0A2K6EIJ4_PROCO
MASGDPHLLLLPSPVPEELHQYSPKRGPYQPNAWCQQTDPDSCTIVVSSSKPRTAAQNSRRTIWDEPDAGFFNVTVIQLEEMNSGIWLFSTFFSCLAPTTSPVWTLTWLPTRTDRQLGVPHIQEGETRVAFLWGSIPGAKSNAPLCLGSAAPGLLVSVLCGLLVAKRLVL